ncbi:MAG: IPT/TIG domain-containing protein [Planctomycetota bacterium]
MKLYYTLFALAAAIQVSATTGLAQYATSLNYQVDDLALTGGGGGVCSNSYAAFIVLAPMSGEEMQSAGYKAALGALATDDPKPTNAPLIFSVLPSCGPVAGGETVRIYGLNFNKPGAAATTAIQFANVTASNVSVVSDAEITVTVPPAPNGSQGVSVSNVNGIGVLNPGYIYTSSLSVFGTGTPGCTGTETLSALACPKIGETSFGFMCNNAPPSSTGMLLVADAADAQGSDTLAAGILLHVDLINATELIPIDIASDASGVGGVYVAVPNNAVLNGLTYTAQAIWYWGTQCSLPPLGLSSSRGLSMTFFQ